jgi:putative ABC transport system permease protein
LKRDTSLFEAQEVMDRTARQFHRQYADFYEDGNPWKVTLAPMHEHITGSIRTPLAVLLGAVALVLLVACANVSSLLLTRAAARQGELAVRAALGAGTHRLVRMLLTEGVLLALLGGGAALLVAYFGIGAVRALAPEGVPRLDEVNIDGRVLAFTLGVSIVVGLLLAILPAFQSVRVDLQQGIKLGVHAATVRSRRRARSILVVAELALALILTIGAGLLTKSFLLLSQVEPGFQPENVLTFEISLSPLKYRDAREASTFHLNAIRQIEALPGVLSAGGVSTLPLGGRDNRAAFTVEGEADPDVRETAVHYRLVSPGYFRAMGIPLLRGRTLSETDDASAPLVLVINQTMARLLWPDSDPIGRRINFGGPDDGDWYRVVGVVGDVKHFGLDAQPEIEVFMTYAQASFQAHSIIVVARTVRDPTSLSADVRSRISSVDPNQPVYNVRPLSAVLSSSVAPQRFNVMMMAAFSTLCLLLAAVGIYGVISYSVGQRTHEMGIRMALGARGRDVLKVIVGQGAALSLLGLLLGVVGALGLTRLLSGLLYGVRPTDPLTFAGVTVLLGLVALLASYLPARRAAKIDPVIALRHE